MAEYVAWMFELEVKKGRDEELKTLMSEMASATRENEPGTLIYEWNFSDDGRTLHLYERYAGSAAAMTHIGTFGARWAGRFFDMLEPKRFTLYGTPSEEVRSALSSPGMTVMTQSGGFNRD
jgi:quinol monooxygenase YgiN